MTDRATSSAPSGSVRRMRVAPHNREAEESVLGAIMLSAEAANLVMDKLESDDFYVPAHQAIFEAIIDLYNANQPIDALTVSDALHRKGELDRIGGAGYLSDVMDAVPTTSNIEYYAGIVEEHGLRRRLIHAGGVLGDLAIMTDQEISIVLDQAEQTVLRVAEHRVGEGLVPMSPLLHGALETIEEMEARGSELTGLPTGFRDLDKKLGGLQPANLVVVASRPSMGKSTLVSNIATNVAIGGGTVAIFSLEMSREEIVQRLLCSTGRVDSMKLRTGQLGPQLWQKVVHAASKMYQIPVYIDDSPQLTVTDIRAKSRRLRRAHGLQLIIIDYLQLMQGSARENRQQEIAEISRSLKNLARELDVPILAVSQLNRSLESREDKRPRLGDLRESGAIEQDADIVMFIYRHEYYHPEAQDTKGLAEVIVAKHRSGSTGMVQMTFLPEFTLFSDLGRDVV